jgi:hypothetical protein
VDNVFAGAIERHQARCAAICWWLLRDQFGRKVEIELPDIHPK